MLLKARPRKFHFTCAEANNNNLSLTPSLFPLLCFEILQQNEGWKTPKSPAFTFLALYACFKMLIEMKTV